MPQADAIRRAAVIGWPVGHSLSPCLHACWLKRYGIPGSYAAEPVDPAHFERDLANLLRKGYCGFNVTVPHKETMLRFIERSGGHVDAAARRIGAVNTVIVLADGRLEGRNTDAYGFAQNLVAGGFRPDARPAVVLGAGGAARGVIVALQEMGVKRIRLSNRTRDRADIIARELAQPACPIDVAPWDARGAALREAGLLVNATSLGMKDANAEPYIDLSFLPEDAFVADIVYVPLETVLLKDARARGLKTVDGLGMLLHQARPAFAAFFGRDPEVTDELRRLILEAS